MNEGILHHAEGVDLMPANIELSGMELSLVNAMSRESILRRYIGIVKPCYHRAYRAKYRANNLEKCREYDRMKAKESRAKKKAKAAEEQAATEAA